MRAARNRLAIAVSAVVAALTFGIAVVPAAYAAGGCENEARRVEQGSTFLPDCRAYELVTPSSEPPPGPPSYFEGHPPSQFTNLETGSFDNPSTAEPDYMPATQEGASIAEDGDAALYRTYNEPNSESDAIAANLARRGPDGWIWENIIPRRARHGFLCDDAGYYDSSANLEQVIIHIGGDEEENQGAALGCGYADPPIVAGESHESGNLFLRDTATRSFQLINVTPAGVKGSRPVFDAVSADGSHTVFTSTAKLTSNAPAEEGKGVTERHCGTPLGNTYVWSAGELHLVTVLPDGTPVQGMLAGSQPAACGNYTADVGFTHALSADGERVLFYAGGGFEVLEDNVSVEPRAPYIDGGLYLREHPGASQSSLNGSGECAEPVKACTVQIDLPQGVAGSGGGGQFRWASADDSRIFFLDEKKLTPDAGAEQGKPDLYEYDVEKPMGERLADLTPSASEPADVRGVSGVSEDGSYVYFVAQGVLSGTQENDRHAKALVGEANLYLRHGGTTTFVVNLNAKGGDQCDWSAICLTSRVSRNGLFIAFDSIDGLTGYDNQPVHPEACQRLTKISDSPCIEAYRYAADSDELTCVTCNPSGAPPAAEFAWSVIEQPVLLDRFTAMTNAVSDAGQVFFETMEKLVPEDENETWDVYEYEGGEGPTAQLHLISTGKSELPSFFADATPDGSNVFFYTTQSLLSADTRSDYDLYDARVGGGFASQSEPIVPPACEALEACRAPLSEPPAEFSVASATLSGAGNLTPQPERHEVEKPPSERPPASKCKKGSVRAHGKCVSKHHDKPGKRHGNAGKRHGKPGRHGRKVGK